jgi:hypothetical protein
MIHPDEVKNQLAEIGANSLLWGRAELRELPKILFESERLYHVLNGRYEGGFAVLCATNYRVLLIDKKPFYLTLEDTRYEMISDVQFNHRLIDASIWIGTVHKRLTFMAYNHSKLRNLTHFIQEQVMSTRQQLQPQSEPQPLPRVQPVTTLDPSQIPANLPPKPVEGALIAQQQPSRPPINPYKTPLMIRHRISRFN